MSFLAPPAELAYAEITSAQTGFSAAADVTGLSVTFTAGVRPVLVEAFIPGVQQQTAAGIVIGYITDSSNTVVQRLTTADVLAGKFFGPLYGKKRLTTLTSGTSYTYKVRMQSTAGTVDVNAVAAVNPAFIRACET